MPIPSGGATLPFWLLLWRQFVPLRFSVVFLGKLSSPSAQRGGCLHSLILAHSPAQRCTGLFQKLSGWVWEPPQLASLHSSPLRSARDPVTTLHTLILGDGLACLVDLWCALVSTDCYCLLFF